MSPELYCKFINNDDINYFNKDYEKSNIFSIGILIL